MMISAHGGKFVPIPGVNMTQSSIILDDDKDPFIYEKELELYKKTKKALWATQNLRDQFEGILNHLEEHGIKRQNLEKISDLTSEYNVNFYQIILDTFDYDKETKEKLLSEISYIDKIFLEFDKIYELKELNVF